MGSHHRSLLETLIELHRPRIFPESGLGLTLPRRTFGHAQVEVAAGAQQCQPHRWSSLPHPNNLPHLKRAAVPEAFDPFLQVLISDLVGRDGLPVGVLLQFLVTHECAVRRDA